MALDLIPKGPLFPEVIVKKAIEREKLNET